MIKNSREGEIVYIDKPCGVTSFDVIRLLRRRYGIKKIGHAGTLDPLASGLLIIGIGSATKKLPCFLKLPKVYSVTVCIGQKTTTGDLEGDIIEQWHNSIPIPDTKLTSVLTSLQGDQMLFVPIYSAIKKNGKPLYKRVRQGEHITPPQKCMHIQRLSLIRQEEKDGYVYITIEMAVGSGTYIRSVVEELGERLHAPTTVSVLRRLSIGNVDVATAEKFSINEFEEILKKRKERGNVRF
ncbi:MAG: tRNA pseudouridine(55) synthase TruB [bacterium]